MIWGAALVALGLALTCSGARGEIPFDGTLSLRTDAWTSDRQLNDRGSLAAVSAWGRGRIHIGETAQLVGNAWVREASRDEGSPRGRVRELYLRQEIGPVTAKLGRQMVVWGRADGLNPTDNLSPRDFTLLAPEDGDLRHGNDALSVSAPAGIGNVSLLLFPQAASHIIPLESIPGVNYRIESPHRHGQWAVKWDGSAQGIDGSLSYFDGRDPMPDLVPGTISPGGVEIVLRNQRARIFGADLSLAHDGVTWRAEAAYLKTDSAGPMDFTHKKSQFWLVAGGEWQFAGGSTVGLQATLQHVFDFADPATLDPGIQQQVARRQAATSGQTSRNQAGLVWRLARRWRNDTLLAETSGVVLGPRGSGVVRAKLDYSVNDRVQVQFGFDTYFGPDDTYFGQLKRNRLAYVQVRYGL